MTEQEYRERVLAEFRALVLEAIDRGDLAGVLFLVARQLDRYQDRSRAAERNRRDQHE